MQGLGILAPEGVGAQGGGGRRLGRRTDRDELVQRPDPVAGEIQDLSAALPIARLGRVAFAGTTAATPVNAASLHLLLLPGRFAGPSDDQAMLVPWFISSWSQLETITQLEII